MTLNDLYDYALSLYGVPYQWGGEGPPKHYGFDCSGFAQHLLRKANVAPPSDLTAEGLYLYYKKYGFELSSPCIGALVFFGQNRIHHVGWMIDNRVLISAAGGNKNCTTADYAAKIQAFVKLQPLSYYQTPVGFLLPKY